MSDLANQAVFLSYASQDAEAARRICEALRSGGVEVWFDADGGLEHGDEWDAKIRRQIKECVLFIPVISANTQARHEGYFRIEWELAAQRAMGIASGVPFILPVVIDATREPAALVPDRFRMVQWTKLRGGEVPPEVQQRFLKLWSHRTGALKHEAGVAQASSPAVSSDAGRKSALPTLNRRVPSAAWIAGVAVITVIVGFIALRPKPNPGGAPVPNAPQGPPATAQAAPPISEARKLVLQARVSIDDDWLAVRENFRLADELCERATKLDPTDGEAWATWARVSAQLIERNYDTSSQRRDGTRSRAERAMQLAPDSIETGLAMALVLAQNGSATDAAQSLRDLLKRAPMDARVARALATTLSPPGKPANAEATEIRLHHPSFAGRDPRPLFDEARTMHDTQRRLAECEAIMARANALAPCWEGYAWNLGYGIYVSGDLDASVKVAQEIPPRLLQEDVFAALVATLWIYKGDGEKARAALARVPRDFIEDRWFFEPTAGFRGDAYALSGKAAAATEQWKQALAVVEKRLVAEPATPSLLEVKAHLLGRLGNKDEAWKTWQLASELGRVQYAAYTEAGLHLASGEREEAILRLQRGLSPMRAVSITSINMLRFDPRFAPVRSDPRIAKILIDGEAMIAKLRRRPDATGDESANAAKPPPVPDAKSVAVLAFANLSDDKDNEYFSDGISEELLNVLGRVPGLRVAAPISAFSFKGKNVSAQEIGQKLNVAYLVNGSVRRAGTAIRVVARLSRAETDEQIWSDKFEGEAKNVFALQDEIAAKIAAALSLKLGAAARAAKPIDPEAYRLYLEGRHFWSLRTFGGLDRAEAALKQAVALEPESALMRAGLAELYATRGWYRSLNALDPGDNFALASAEAERAVALDPENAQAVVAHATIAIVRRQFVEAARLLRQALALAPSDAAAFDRLGDLMVRTGRLDAAVENYQRAMQLDPLSVYLVRDVVRELTCAHRFQEAIDTVDRFEAAAPRDWRTLVWRSQALVHFGKTDQAAGELKAILPSITPDEFSSSGSSIAELVFSLRLAKCEPESEALAKRLLDRYQPGTYLHAMVLAARGRMEEALPLLAAFPTGGEDRLYWSAVFDPVRDDPRFLRKIEEFGVGAEYKVARETLARMLGEQAAKK